MSLSYRSYPLRLIKNCDGGLWIGKHDCDRIMLEHLTGGRPAVPNKEISDLRFLALLHEWKLLLPGERFEG